MSHIRTHLKIFERLLQTILLPWKCSKAQLNKKLLVACLKGNLRLVQKWVRAGGDIEIRNKEGWTPLICACISGSCKVVEFLLSIGVDIHRRDWEMKTALIHSSAKRCTGITTMLIKSGAQVDVHCACGVTPLMEACFIGCASSVRSLLMDGHANIHVVDDYGRSALHYAIGDSLSLSGGCLSPCREKSKSPSKSQFQFSQFSQFSELASLQSLQVKNYLFSSSCTSTSTTGPKSNTNSDARERLAIVAELINLGLDPSVPELLQFKTPLMLACEAGLENVASYLLALGVKVNMASNTGDTALHLACKGKLYRFAEMLLLHGADAQVQNVEGLIPFDYLDEKLKPKLQGVVSIVSY